LGDDRAGTEFIKEFSNKNSAKRRYQEAVAQMKQDEEFKKEWEHNLKTQKKCIDEKWFVKSTDVGFDIHSDGRVIGRFKVPKKGADR